MRAVGLGHHEQAGGVLVQAMHDARPLDAADAGEGSPAMGDERVDQRAVGMAGARVHGQPLGLVDDDQVGVLVDDRERHRLRLDGGGLGLRQVHGIGLARPDAPTELGLGRAVPQHVARADQRLQPRAAQAGKPPRQEAVEPLASLRLGDGQEFVRVVAGHPGRVPDAGSLIRRLPPSMWLLRWRGKALTASDGGGQPGGQPVRNA